jgi:hypothetical protein
MIGKLLVTLKGLMATIP